jgi:dephospho-CoA kinase
MREFRAIGSTLNQIAPRMKVLGLTGGVGMGKSTAALFLEEWGAAVIDTDRVAREVVEPGQPSLKEIQALFGTEVISPDGSLRREALARLVFANARARAQLETILHPRIRECWLARVAAWRDENRSIAVVVIPLLFETGAEGEFDATLCVACSTETQRERLLPRGWTEAQIDQRIRAQWSVQKKMHLADYVIWTEGGLEAHAEQLQRVMQLVLVAQGPPLR